MATGYGLIEPGPRTAAVVVSGVIVTDAERPLAARLQQIYDGVDRLLAAHVPSRVVIEDLYAEYSFPRTALLMAHARGVICLAAEQHKVPVLALAPAEVKRAIAAHGAASKAQIQEGVRRLLRLSAAPRPSHVADALALALTGFSRAGGAPGMIATLSGRLRRRLEDRIILEVGGVGYEVFLPPIALRALEGAHAEGGEKAAELALVIYYHATRDQPRPVLIGFTSDLDKEFFERLITVKDIGPMVAARALAAPVAELAAAIARQDEKYLRALPGIGPQKAKNIVAQLSAKVAKFALAREEAPAAAPPSTPVAPDADGLREMVWEILTKQLGHRPSEASQLITDALRRRPGIATPEELFDEIYRSQAAAKRA